MWTTAEPEWWLTLNPAAVVKRESDESMVRTRVHIFGETEEAYNAPSAMSSIMRYFPSLSAMGLG